MRSSGNSVQVSNVFQIAIGEAIAKAANQMTGTVDMMSLPLGGDSWGQTINCRRSKAMAVMLKVDTNMEVACKSAATGQAAG